MIARIRAERLNENALAKTSRSQASEAPDGRHRCRLCLQASSLGHGFIDRAQSKQEVVDWTNAQAIPTVALAQRIAAAARNQTLTLPAISSPSTGRRSSRASMVT